MTGRTYLDPGDRLAGYYDPPRLCRVIQRFGPPVKRPQTIEWLNTPKRAGPRNVLVEYADDGSRAVITFWPRLRKPAVESL